MSNGLARQHSGTLDLIFRVADMAIIWGLLPPLMMAREVKPDLTHWYWLLASIAITVFYLFSAQQGLYRSWRGARSRSEHALVFRSWGFTAGALLLLGYTTKQSSVYSRQVLLSWIALVPFVLCLWRIMLREALAVFRVHGRNSRRAAVVGATDTARELMETMEGNPDMGLRLAGLYDGNIPTGDKPFEQLDVAVVGSVNDMIAAAKDGKLDCVYVTYALSETGHIDGIVRALADTTVNLLLVPTMSEVDLFRATWTSVGDLSAISVYDTPFYGVDGAVKRIEDLVLGLVFLAIAAIPMALIALVVRLTSTGPALYHQKRYGINGKEIDVLKFRTMRVDHEGEGGMKQATKNDSRLTPIGGFLRKTSLDEFPQLFNVLLGSMSLVGPRPHAVAHNEYYRKQIHGYMLRHKVKPGITGLAQVRGFRGETDTVDKMESRVDCDLEYIRNWSLTLDIKIVALTMIKGFVGKNAY